MPQEPHSPPGHVELGLRVIQETELGPKLAEGLARPPFGVSGLSEFSPTLEPDPDFFWALYNLKTGLDMLTTRGEEFPVGPGTISPLVVGTNIGDMQRAVLSRRITHADIAGKEGLEGSLGDVEGDYLMPLAAKMRADRPNDTESLYKLTNGYVASASSEEVREGANLQELQAKKFREVMWRLDHPEEGGDPSYDREPRTPRAPKDSDSIALRIPKK